VAATAGKDFDLQRPEAGGQIDFVHQRTGVDVHPRVFENRGQGGGPTLKTFLWKKRCLGEFAVARQAGGFLKQLLRLWGAGATGQHDDQTTNQCLEDITKATPGWFLHDVSQATVNPWGGLVKPVVWFQLMVFLTKGKTSV
jgi:hypothetical protein